MRAMSVSVRQYANGVNKGTLSANVAKVEAKEKELAAAKAAAKVLRIPTASLPHSHHSSAYCSLQDFCAREMWVPDWPCEKVFWGGEGRGFGLALVRLRWQAVSFRRELGFWKSRGARGARRRISMMLDGRWFLLDSGAKYGARRTAD